MLIAILLLSSARINAQSNFAGFTVVGNNPTNNVFGNSVSAMTTDAAGNIYAAGSFKDATGNLFVAKFDGTNWTQLGGAAANFPGVGIFLSSSSTISCLLTDNAGNVYAAGDGIYDGNFKTYVAKFDGTSWSILGDTASIGFFKQSTIRTITKDAAGNIYAAGTFTNVNNKQFVAKFDGTNWSELGGANSTSIFNDGINIITTDIAGNIYAGGNFTNGSTTCFVAKFSGGSWAELGGANTSPFEHTISSGNHPQITSIAVDATGKVYAASFEFSCCSANSDVAKFDGNNWGFVPLGDFMPNNNQGSGHISSLVFDAAGNLLIGGSYGFSGVSFVDGNPSVSRLLGRLRNTTSGMVYESILNNSSGTDSLHGFGGTVNAILTTSNGDVVIGGSITKNTASGQNQVFKLKLACISPITSKDSSVCSSSLPISIGGLTFSAAGTQFTHKKNIAGCDSLIVISVTVKQASTSTTNITVCSSQLPFNWNGTNLSSNGPFTAHLTNAIGCDSAATVVLTVTANPVVNKITSNALSSTPNDSTFCSINAIRSISNSTVGGLWSVSNSAVASLNNSTSNPVNLTAVANGTAIVSYTLTTGGCSTTVSKLFTVAPATQTIVQATAAVCLGSSITLAGTPTGGSWAIGNTSPHSNINTNTGLLTGNSAGRDSVVYSVTNGAGCSNNNSTIVTVKQTSSSTKDTSICHNSFPITISNTRFDSATTKVIHLNNAIGCDSVVTITVKEIANPVVNKITSNALSSTPNDSTFCSINAIRSISNSTVGGVWSVSNSTASLSSNTGSPVNLTSLTNGIAIVSYTKTTSGCTTTVSKLFTIAPVDKPQVSATATVCLGSSITLAGTPTGGSWAIGNTSPHSSINSSTGLLTGNSVGRDSVVYNVTNSAGCNSFNSTIVTVNFSVTPTITINNPGTTCSGQGRTYSANTTNASVSGTIQWQLNGQNFGSPTSTSNASITFLANQISNGNIVRAILTTNNSCQSVATVVSNTDNVSLASSVTPTIFFQKASTNICDGTQLSFTVGTTNAGTSPQFNWKKTVNGVTTALITTTSPTMVTSPTGFSGGDIITCTLNANNSCQTIANVTTNPGVTLTTTPISAARDTIIATSTNVCNNNTISFTATPTNGGTNPTYQWKKNNANFGTPSTKPDTVITISTSGLVVGDKISCTMTANNTCQTVSSATSNIITLTGSTFNKPVVKLATFCTIGDVLPLQNNGSGKWQSSDPIIVTASPATSGNTILSNIDNIKVINNGKAALTLTDIAANGCITVSTDSVFVDAIPAPVAITGPTVVCVGSSIILNSGSQSGTWSSSTGTATVSSISSTTTLPIGASIAVKGIGVGNPTIVHTITNVTKTCSKVANYPISVVAIPSVPTITYGPGWPNPQIGSGSSANFCKNAVFSVVGSPAGGVWTSTGPISHTFINSSTERITIGSLTLSGTLTYTFTNNSGCSNFRTINGNVVACAGSRGVNISSKEEVVRSSEFTMYPNPAKTFISLNVNTLNGNGSIVITDLYGKQVKTQPLSMGNNTVDIANLSKGFYLVGVITSEGKTTRKLVVE